VRGIGFVVYPGFSVMVLTHVTDRDPTDSIDSGFECGFERRHGKLDNARVQLSHKPADAGAGDHEPRIGRLPNEQGGGSRLWQ